MKDLARLIRDIEAEVKLTQGIIGKSHLDPRVMEAIRRVPREEFVPEEERHLAYENGPLPIGYGQTISQPYIVALMTDLLDAEPDDVILEIGTGSCYQAAVLSHLVRHVHTVEIVPELAAQSRERLEHLGYSNVTVHEGDGYYGWPEQAPYDGIVVTAAAPAIPEPLIEQLKPGAKLVIPIGLPYQYQELMVFEKDRQGGLRSRTVIGVAFVPLTGDLGATQREVPPAEPAKH